MAHPAVIEAGVVGLPQEEAETWDGSARPSWRFPPTARHLRQTSSRTAGNISASTRYRRRSRSLNVSPGILSENCFGTNCSQLRRRRWVRSPPADDPDKGGDPHAPSPDQRRENID